MHDEEEPMEEVSAREMELARKTARPYNPAIGYVIGGEAGRDTIPMEEDIPLRYDFGRAGTMWTMKTKARLKQILHAEVLISKRLGQFSHAKVVCCDQLCGNHIILKGRILFYYEYYGYVDNDFLCPYCGVKELRRNGHEFSFTEYQAFLRGWFADKRLKMMHRKRQMRREEWCKECPPEFLKEIDLDLIPEDLHRLLRWKITQCAGKGVMAYGDTGLCKSRIAWKVLKNHFMLGYRVKGLTFSQFKTQSSEMAYNNCTGDWLKYLAGQDVLLIDDVGKANLTITNQADFFAIVDFFYSNNKPLWITTNLLAREIGMLVNDDYREPLLRRLSEMMEVVNFNGIFHSTTSPTQLIRRTNEIQEIQST